MFFLCIENIYIKAYEINPYTCAIFRMKSGKKNDTLTILNISPVKM